MTQEIEYELLVRERSLGPPSLELRCRLRRHLLAIWVCDEKSVSLSEVETVAANHTAEVCG